MKKKKNTLYFENKRIFASSDNSAQLNTIYTIPSANKIVQLNLVYYIMDYQNKVIKRVALKNTPKQVNSTVNYF